jgi:hypothetical protein
VVTSEPEIPMVKSLLYEEVLLEEIPSRSAWVRIPVKSTFLMRGGSMIPRDSAMVKSGLLFRMRVTMSWRVTSAAITFIAVGRMRERKRKRARRRDFVLEGVMGLSYH